jgi:hypothetical protein
MSEYIYNIYHECITDPNVSGYCKREYTELPGNDIDTKTHIPVIIGGKEYPQKIKLTDCSKLCNENSDCKAFIYNFTDPKCILKNSYYNIKKTENGSTDGTLYTKSGIEKWNHKVSTSVKPNVLKCNDVILPDIASDDDIKRCSDAADCMVKNKELNSSIDIYNFEQQQIYNDTKKYYDMRKQEYDRMVSKKTKEYEDRKVALENDIQTMCTNECERYDADFPNTTGTNWMTHSKYGSCKAGRWKIKQCKRTPAYINVILKNEFPNYPYPSFDEHETPPIKDELYPAMNKTPNQENVQCCYNIANITGDASDISQSCDQSIEQTKELVEEEKKITVITEPVIIPTTTDAPPPPEEKSELSGVEIGFIVGGAVILFVLLAVSLLKK